jgi:hypothetical protein
MLTAAQELVPLLTCLLSAVPTFACFHQALAVVHCLDALSLSLSLHMHRLSQGIAGACVVSLFGRCLEEVVD